LLIIRIYVDYKIDNATIKEINEIDISVIYNILSKRKTQLRELNIDVCDNSHVIILIS